jgi:hypothetical protein
LNKSNKLKSRSGWAAERTKIAELLSLNSEPATNYFLLCKPKHWNML